MLHLQLIMAFGTWHMHAELMAYIPHTLTALCECEHLLSKKWVVTIAYEVQKGPHPTL